MPRHDLVECVHQDDGVLCADCIGTLFDRDAELVELVRQLADRLDQTRAGNSVADAMLVKRARRAVRR